MDECYNGVNLRSVEVEGREKTGDGVLDKKNLSLLNSTGYIYYNQQKSKHVTTNAKKTRDNC